MQPQTPRHDWEGSNIFIFALWIQTNFVLLFLPIRLPFTGHSSDPFKMQQNLHPSYPGCRCLLFSCYYCMGPCAYIHHTQPHRLQDEPFVWQERSGVTGPENGSMSQSEYSHSRDKILVRNVMEVRWLTPFYYSLFLHFVAANRGGGNYTPFGFSLWRGRESPHSETRKSKLKPYHFLQKEKTFTNCDCSLKGARNLLSIFLWSSQISPKHPGLWILLKSTHGALPLTTAAGDAKVTREQRTGSSPFHAWKWE